MSDRVRRGDLRMVRFRSPDKERPVVVLTRDDVIPYLNAVMVAPITSLIRDVPSHVLLDERHGLKMRSAAKLDAVMTVFRARLGPWLGRLGPREMATVCEALRVATGCDATMVREPMS